MPGPMTGVRFIHCAIEREAAAIEADAAALADATAAQRLAARVAFFERVNDLHTEGEEIAIFPPLEERLKHQAGTYLLDHAGDRVLFREIHALLAKFAHGFDTEQKVKARVMRQTAALADSLALHIRKENEILVPLLESLFSRAEQVAMVGKAVGHFPPGEMQHILPWLVGWLDPPDREAYLRDLTLVMPPPVLAAAAGWLKTGLAADAWSDLKARIPELPA